MNIVIKVGKERSEWWKEHMSSILPNYNIFLAHENYDKDKIDFAIVWKPKPGWLKTLSNLKCIVSMGSGIDHILCDPHLPKKVPIIRTTGYDLNVRMKEYVILHVLRHHRNLTKIIEINKKREWKSVIEPPMHERIIGIMGLGNLGADCAKTLAYLGFKVKGWSKSKKQLDGVTSFTGNEELEKFIKDVEILVCMLPLTSETEGILNSSLFSKMQKGLCLINAARGEHLVDEDLLEYIKNETINEATLDVFHIEPLPVDHAFWSNEKILITPHIASLIDPIAGGKEIAMNIKKFVKGEYVKNLIPLGKDY